MKRHLIDPTSENGFSICRLTVRQDIQTADPKHVTCLNCRRFYDSNPDWWWTSYFYHRLPEMGIAFESITREYMRLRKALQHTAQKLNDLLARIDLEEADG